MKSLNFNCKEVLPALLDKSKVQTIRKAWKTDNYPHIDNPKQILWSADKEKPAKFVVGDRVKLYWKKTSKDDWFCKKCGLGIGLSEYGTSISYSCKKHIPNDSIFPREKLYKYIFNKCLGEVEITEVYKIELAEWHIKIQECGGLAYSTPYPWGSKVSWDLSDRDGFKGNKDMFKYFDENYDLSSPKPFWVYEWGWL